MKKWILEKRWRIIFAGLLISIVPASLLAVFMHFTISRQMENEAIQRRADYALTAVHVIEAKLAGDLAFGKAYAARPYLIEGIIKRDKKEMLRHLKNLLETSNSIERASIISDRGAMLANYPEDPAAYKIDFSQREWFKEFSETWSPYVSGFFLRVVGPKRYVFLFAVPVKTPDGKNIAVISMSAKGNYIKDAMDRIKTFGGFIYVTDKNGNLIYHPDYPGDRLVDVSSVPAVKKVKNNLSGAEKMYDPLRKETVIAGYVPVEKWGWGIVTHKSLKEVMSPARSLSAGLFAMAGFALLLGGFFAYHWSELFASSIKTETALRESELELKKVLNSVEEKVNERTTELKVIEAHLLSHSRELKVFAESTSALLMMPSSENVYEAVCETAAKIFDLRIAWLGIIGDDAIASPVAQSGCFADEPAVTPFIWDCASEDDGLSSMAIRTRMPQSIDDIYLYERSSGWRATFLTLECRSAISVPLISSESKITGSLNLFHSAPNYFILDRLEILRVFANYVSFVIENRWMIEGLEKKVKERTKKLEKAKLQAETANRTKSDFLASMSHELRTPLNAVMGFSEILEDQLYGELNEKQKEYVRDIAVSGKHLLNLINDILDLSKVEAGKMELEMSSFMLRDILSTSMSMLKEKAMKHSIKLSCDIEPDADIEIEADERKFKQIMFNLLSNAVKFTADGGFVQVTARRVKGQVPRVKEDRETGSSAKGQGEEGISLLRDPMTLESEADSSLATCYLPLDPDRDFIEISVSDTGIGIKPEDMDKLFREFLQIDAGYTKKYEGTGLGLVLTKKFIELHGGEIWVESEFGKGSRFCFVIPIRQLQAASFKVQGET